MFMPRKRKESDSEEAMEEEESRRPRSVDDGFGSLLHSRTDLENLKINEGFLRGTGCYGFLRVNPSPLEMRVIYPLVESIRVDTRGISIAYANGTYVLTNQQLCEMFEVPLSAREEMWLEVPGKLVDNSRLVTLCCLTDGDAHQLQRVNGLGRLAYGKIPNLGMRSLVKYGTTRILLKIGYDHMDPFRGSIFAKIVDKLLHPVQVFKAMLHPLVVGGRPKMRSMSAVIITWIISQLMETDSSVHRPKELKQELKTARNLLVSPPRRTHIDARLFVMRSGSLLSEFDQSESVQVDFVKKQRKEKEVSLVDVSHLVTPEERRGFLDEPIPQNGVTLGGARISEVTSLAKVLLEELVVAQGDQVMAPSELTPLRSEHDKVLTEKQGELKKKHKSEFEEWEKTRQRMSSSRDRKISSAKRKEEMDKLKFDSEIAKEISKARLMYDELLRWKGKYKAAKVSDDTSTATLQDDEEMVAMKELA
ncbi:unnamed protein product [Calypogeia fissa]